MFIFVHKGTHFFANQSDPVLTNCAYPPGKIPLSIAEAPSWNLSNLVLLKDSITRIFNTTCKFRIF